MLLPVLRRVFVSAINEDATLWWKLLENRHLLVSAAHAAAIHFGDIAFDALVDAVLPATIAESRSTTALRVRVLIQGSLSAGADINDMEARMMDISTIPENCDAGLPSFTAQPSESAALYWLPGLSSIFKHSTTEWMRNLHIVASDDWIQRFSSYRDSFRDFGSDLGLPHGSRGLVSKMTTESAIRSLLGNLTSNSAHRRSTTLRRFQTLEVAHDHRCSLAKNTISTNQSPAPPTSAVRSWQRLVSRVRQQRLVVPALTAGLRHMSPVQLDTAGSPVGLRSSGCHALVVNPRSP